MNQQEWRPISEATDSDKSTSVLLYFRVPMFDESQWHIETGYWCEDSKSWEVDGHMVIASHFMPLPPPPKRETKGPSESLKQAIKEYRESVISHGDPEHGR